MTAAGVSFQMQACITRRYSKTRVAVPRGYSSKWIFPQEKATSHTFREGTFTLIFL
jgi:hypothetical protein